VQNDCRKVLTEVIGLKVPVKHLALKQLFVAFITNGYSRGYFHNVSLCIKLESNLTKQTH